MLAKPFVGMPRSRLITLLIVFVCLEVAGAFGLVLTNHKSSAAPAVAVNPAATMAVAPRPSATPVPDVQSSSPTLAVGATSVFSTQLPPLAHQVVTYQIRYPDGAVRFLYAHADAHGSSHLSVKISTHARVPHGTVGVGVYYQNKKYAFTHFPVAGN